MNKNRKLNIGDIWKSNNYGDFIILENLGKINNISMISIKFINLNIFGLNTITHVQLSHARIGNVKDYYQPYIYI